MTKKITEKVIEKNKIESLNPVQKEAIKMGLLNGKNLIVASPTSSGKTLLAELAALNIVLNKKKKMVYFSPLVALAREKYEGFKEKYRDLKIKTALSVGNFDSQDSFLEDFDWIFLSNEKMDSLIRHNAPWISNIGLIVADEVHLLNDFERGPTLEILLTVLKQICVDAQFLLLSATIKNSQDLGKWIGAEVLKSDFRPTPLYLGILHQNKLKIFGREEYILNKNKEEEALLENTLLMKKQIIFFLSSRRNAESLAERLSKIVYHFLDKKEEKELENVAKKIERALEVSTDQCKKLAKCIKNGIAFYHSGLLFSQRVEIEEAYKRRLIKAITSTTGLAFGVNLPNFRAVVRDVKRYYPGLGSFFLPVLEVQQMFGRSGRPQYDKWGEGILIAKNEIEAKELKEYYIDGEIEEIESKIFNERSQRMHILALIAGQFVKSEKDLLIFIKKTFFGIKTENIAQFEDNIQKIINNLEKWGFIQIQEKENDIFLVATKIGKRVSQLYIDPASSNLIIEGLKNYQKENDFGLLLLLAKTNELKPSPTINSKDYSIIEENIYEKEEKSLLLLPDELDDDYEEFQKEIKMALIFEAWLEEKTENEIFELYKITPGDLYLKLEIADWLLYSMAEIGKILFFREEVIKEIRKLRKRMRYGVKEELLDLVRVKGIGRKRARKLFDGGIKNLKLLKAASVEKIATILKSKVLAEKIKKEVSF